MYGLNLIKPAKLKLDPKRPKTTPDVEKIVVCKRKCDIEVAQKKFAGVHNARHKHKDKYILLNFKNIFNAFLTAVLPVTS